VGPGIPVTYHICFFLDIAAFQVFLELIFKNCAMLKIYDKQDIKMRHKMKKIPWYTCTLQDGKERRSSLWEVFITT
jgi:hypothetical protein